MDFGTAIKTCFSKYADFDGRASRSEYWFFFLFYWLVLTVLQAAIYFWLVMSTMPSEGTAMFILSIPTIWFFAALIPHIAVSVRRLHDIGKSGWWFLISLTGIGAIVLLIWFASEGTTKGYTGPAKRRASARDYDDAPEQRSRSGKVDVIDELEELKELYEDGTLSEAQFKKAKNKLLK